MSARMSARWAARACSGAMYSGVPMTVLAWGQPAGPVAGRGAARVFRGRLADEAGQSEIEDLDDLQRGPVAAADLVDDQVLRLDVAVNHAALEGVFQPHRRLAG